MQSYCTIRSVDRLWAERLRNVNNPTHSKHSMLCCVGRNTTQKLSLRLHALLDKQQETVRLLKEFPKSHTHSKVA